jgi:small-conductance mechanosensitive channel
MLSDSNKACLNFETLALVAVDSDGTLDQQKLKELVKVFRPDRNGDLTLLDFAKSVDAVYKDMRLLRAGVANSSKIDHAFETLFNFAFYIVLFFIAIGVLGYDPWVFFASVTGIIVGFGFMIGAACSKYIEGLLLVLVRRPYDIGDRIHVSDVNTDTSTSGSLGWIVKDVGLYTTTVVLGATNEVATYSNGSLASSRIINAARSPQAVLFFLLKFPIDVPYEKLKVFRNALEEFVKARPREWLVFLAFRATRVEADMGFVEYIVVAQHRYVLVFLVVISLH